MAFDWFTFIAQLVNFVLLLVLLRVFLYRPVLNIMDQREQRLSGMWNEAEQARTEAGAEAERLAAELRQLETARTERLDAVEAEAEQLLGSRLTEIEQEAAASRDRYRAAVQEGREQAVERLRSRSARLLVDELESSLVELADSNLERRAINVFTDRLQALDSEQLQELRAAAGDHTPVVTTAFEADEAVRQEITKLLGRELGAAAEPEFRQDERLLFGIELVVGSLRIAASGSQRLESLNDAWSRTLSEVGGQATAGEDRGTR